ncbi:hypothetical protein EPO15_03700 [bacterium]|nr:MAG: hypothetical protein EPO15_03700 [bacterium]
MKRLLFALAGLGVLALAGGLALSLAFGPAVKAAVETLGPQVAGVPMRLGSFSVSPLTGSVRLRGLVVGNPPGYKTPSAFELADIRVRVRLRSLLSDPVVVEHVIVRGAAATYEMGPGGSNVAVIQRKAASFSGGGGKASGGGPGKRLVIKDFRFEGGKARLSAGLLAGKALEVPIPDVRLKDIGGDRGTSPAAAAARILGAVTSSVAQAALEAGKGVGDVLKTADKAFAGLKKLFK